MIENRFCDTVQSVGVHRNAKTVQAPIQEDGGDQGQNKSEQFVSHQER